MVVTFKGICLFCRHKYAIGLQWPPASDEVIPLEEFSLCPMPIGGVAFFARPGESALTDVHISDAFVDFNARVPAGLRLFLFYEANCQK